MMKLKINVFLFISKETYYLTSFELLRTKENLGYLIFERPHFFLYLNEVIYYIYTYFISVKTYC